MAGLPGVLCLGKNVKFINDHLRKTLSYRNFTHLHSKQKSAFNISPAASQVQQSSTNHKEVEKSKVSGGILAFNLNKTPSNVPISQPVRGCFHPGASVLAREALPLKDRAPVTGTEMIQAMLQYIWPKDDKMIRDRVKLAISLLIGAKVLNVTVPFIFKYAVDYVNAGAVLNMDTAPQTAATVLTSLLLGCTNVILLLLF